MNKLTENLSIIINLLGDINEYINSEELNDIIEEIDNTLYKEDYYILSIYSINLGKPDIFEFIINKNFFSIKDINILKKKVIEHYKKHKDIFITEKFNKIINEYGM